MEAALRALKSGVRGKARQQLTNTTPKKSLETTREAASLENDELPPSLDFFGDNAPTKESKKPQTEEQTPNEEKEVDARPATIATKALLDAMPAALANGLAALGVTSLTQIQRRALPRFSQHDILAVAPTGSGKTYAYALPLLIAHNELTPEEKREKFVRSLVIVPTRELATQVAQVIRRLIEASKLRGIRVREVASKATSKSMRGAIAHIVIATPMAASNALSSKILDIGRVRHVVLDEADRLLDDNFLEQVDTVMAAAGKDGKEPPRVHMYSATLPGGVEVMARALLRDPVKLVVSAGAYGGAAAVTGLGARIKQSFLFVGGRGEQGKVLAVRNMLKKGLNPPVLVFVQSKDRAAQLFRELVFEGISVDAIHADRSDAARASAIERFRDGTLWMLIATDVLARGLDFLGVNTVISYDVPTSEIQYVHRIGRTGRNGRNGEAITLFTEEDKMHLPRVLKIAKASGAEVPQWMLDLRMVTRKEKVKKLEKRPPKRKRVGGPNAPKVTDRDTNYKLPRSRDEDVDGEERKEKRKRRKKKKNSGGEKAKVSLEEND